MSGGTSTQESFANLISQIVQPKAGLGENFLSAENIRGILGFFEQTDFLKGLEGQLGATAARSNAEAEAALQRDLDAVGDQAREGATRAEFFRTQQQGAGSGQVASQQLESILGGGAASPEQLASIRAASDAALTAGISDVDRFTDDAISRVQGAEASARGLRPGDSPIIDRVQSFAQEGLRQKIDLANKIRAEQLQQELQFPLQANAANAQQAGQFQNFARAGQDFQAQLNDSAFQNRLRLSGQGSQFGLGVAGLFPNPTQGLAVGQQPRLAATGPSQVSQTTSGSESLEGGF